MKTKIVAVYEEEERKKIIAYQTAVDNLGDICANVDCQGMDCLSCPLWSARCNYEKLQDSLLNIV